MKSTSGAIDEKITSLHNKTRMRSFYPSVSQRKIALFDIYSGIYYNNRQNSWQFDLPILFLMYLDRACDLTKFLQRKSCFLFGPRQTGKSSLIRHTLQSVPVYNLLDLDVYLKLSRSPGRLKEELDPKERIVVIDEIQKLPALLDMVHMLIEERGTRFLLTGSSARKLRRGGATFLVAEHW